MHKKTLEILVGIPCSGKSTYSKDPIHSFFCNVTILSRDNIRLKYFGKDYKQNQRQEEIVTKIYNNLLYSHLNNNYTTHMILDNTHCKESYIDEIVNNHKDDCNIKITFFDIPLWRAKLRNYIRYLKTGKWIPIKVINSMYTNYNKINKKKYEHLVHK